MNEQLPKYTKYFNLGLIVLAVLAVMIIFFFIFSRQEPNNIPEDLAELDTQSQQGEVSEISIADPESIKIEGGKITFPKNWFIDVALSTVDSSGYVCTGDQCSLYILKNKRSPLFESVALSIPGAVISEDSFDSDSQSFSEEESLDSTYAFFGEDVEFSIIGLYTFAGGDEIDVEPAEGQDAFEITEILPKELFGCTTGNICINIILSSDIEINKNQSKQLKKFLSDFSF